MGEGFRYNYIIMRKNITRKCIFIPTMNIFFSVS